MSKGSQHERHSGPLISLEQAHLTGWGETTHQQEDFTLVYVHAVCNLRLRILMIDLSIRCMANRRRHKCGGIKSNTLDHLGCLQIIHSHLICCKNN